MIGIVVQSSLNAWKKYKKKKSYASEGQFNEMEEDQKRQEVGADGMHDLSSINSSNAKMLREQDLEEAIHEVEAKNRREPIELMQPVIPAPTPAPVAEPIVESLPQPEVIAPEPEHKTSFAAKVHGANERRGKLLQMMEESLK